MRWGLRHQLLVPPLLLLLAVAGITTWTALAAAERARRQLDDRVRQIAEGLTRIEFPRTQTVYQLLRDISGAEWLELVADHHILGGTLDTVPAHLPPPHASPQEVHLDARVLIRGEPYLCSGFVLKEKSEVYLFYPEALWRDALWQAIRPSLLIGGGMGLAAVALALAVGQRLTRRIQELERRTRQIAAGDFSPMQLPRRLDEIHDLAVSVNDMAEKLARLQETVQRTERLRLLGQVSGGLAHQLRNGVAGARLAVQLHQRERIEGGTPDPSALEVALRQLTIVETNLKRFLDLGRRQPGVVRPCSLNALVGEAVSLLEPQCRHARINLHWAAPVQESILQGDMGQLQQLFLNVLGNAVEAAGPGGTVEVVLRNESAKNVIEVSDTGPGPAPEVAERLFEPFVTGKPEGVGLGLAVARQAAESHNGRIGWERRDDRTVFRIELGSA